MFNFVERIFVGRRGENQTLLMPRMPYLCYWRRYFTGALAQNKTVHGDHNNLILFVCSFL